ncbi:MAG: hypothetical protein HOV71_00805 [Hamadaea sp.]|nr:hypothetical protein [Hamadaea sp.]NUR46648.1 hypothetical protein [Hamadaea sp.]NUT07247.1 hypothetical protein [Hamadaea sp.]
MIEAADRGKMAATDTFQRPADLAARTDPAALYVRSYLNIRTVVGVIGLALPIAFIVGEAAYLRGSVHVRGSISAYYHSSMRDLFVAGLSVVGFLLLTYMSAQPRTWDYWLSTVAGIAVVGVVFFPTRRVGIQPGAPLCGVEPQPAGCAPIQQALGENTVAIVHFVCAAVFISCLAAIAFIFAYREKKYENDRRMALVQKICGWAIVAAVVWVAVGGLLRLTLGELTPLYLGEVVAVWAFGTSWLLKGRDLTAVLFPPKPGPEPASTEEPEPRVV